MSRQDIISMSVREQRRLKVVEQAIEKKITQAGAGEVLGVSERQIRRLVRKVRQEGAKGVIHGSRGRESNRKIADSVKSRVLELYQEKYPDFGPTFACEKLLERDGIEISDETLRCWLLEEGLWQRRRKRRKHRQWRERKACCGEMVQMDGSHHDWLEGRGRWLVLIAYIDDATNRVFARFYDDEGTLSAMDSVRGYVKQHGVPQSVYLDKLPTYKAKRKLTVEEELAGVSSPRSQFERALRGLGVEVIHAHSPQAKGRIERGFGTLQDRLVKEMRLAGVRTKEEANRFLEGYLPVHNERFSIAPAREGDLHWQLPKDIDLQGILSVQTKRALRNDLTVAHRSKLYQIEGLSSNARVKHVIVQDRIDGSMHVTYNGRELRYHEIERRPVKRREQKPRSRQKISKPAPDHPWRRRYKPPSWRERQQQETAVCARPK